MNKNRPITALEIEQKKVYIQPQVDVNSFKRPNIIATSGGDAYFDIVDFLEEEE